jgi:hypothetical protein
MRLKMIREVSLMADGFYNQAEALGKIAAKNELGIDEEVDEAKGSGDKKRKHRSQITGLESIANSALKVTDVINYLKTQTARRKFWQTGELGQQVLKFINVDLVDKKRQICTQLQLPLDQGEAQQIYLHLIREFVYQFAAQYEYQCMLAEAKK